MTRARKRALAQKLLHVSFALLLLSTLALSIGAQESGRTESLIPKRIFKHTGTIVTKKLDEKKDVTIVYLKEMPVPIKGKKGVSLKMHVDFSYKGSEPIIPANMMLMFRAETNDKIFPEKPKVTITYGIISILVTSEPLAAKNKKGINGYAHSDWQPNPDYRKKGSDLLYLDLPLDYLLQILNAETVTFSTGSVEFQFSEENLEALRDLLSRGK